MCYKHVGYYFTYIKRAITAVTLKTTGGACFKSQLGCWVTWLRFFMIFLIYPTLMWGYSHDQAMIASFQTLSNTSVTMSLNTLQCLMLTTLLYNAPHPTPQKKVIFLALMVLMVNGCKTSTYCCIITQSIEPDIMFPCILLNIYYIKIC
jgi:hypothetical protein